MLDSSKARERFARAIKDSLAKKRPYLQQRQEWVKQLLGPNWGPLGMSGESRPIAQLEKYYTVMTRLLAGGLPRCKFTTNVRSLRGMAEDATFVINQAAEKANLGRAYRRWVQQSLYGLGILKVGLRVRYDLDDETGQPVEQDELSAMRIPFDDWVHDFSAQSLDPDELWYCGHKFRMPLDEAREHPLFAAHKSRLSAKARSDTDGMGNRTLASLGARNAVEPLDHCELWELYFPKERRLVVCDETFTDAPLFEEQYGGPETNNWVGPYHFAVYTEIEGQTMPLPPGIAALDIDRSTNSIFSKQIDNVLNEKTILTYLEGHDDYAASVASAENMQTVAVGDPSALQEFRFNGVSGPSLAVLLQAMEINNANMGNIDLLAGQSSAAETATENTILNAAATSRIDDMRDVINEASRGVMEHWAWYYWHDPRRIDATVRNIPELKFDKPVIMTPEIRQATWQHLNFDIVSYSMTRRTPQQKSMMLDAIVQQVLLPAAEMLMQGGPLAKMLERYLRLKAEYENVPELAELITDLVGENPMQDQPIGERPRQPAVSNRNYTRRNVSNGPSRQGRQNEMMQTLLLSSLRPGQNGAA